MKNALETNWLRVGVPLLVAIAALALPAAHAADPVFSGGRVVAPESEVCKGCHADYVDRYKDTKHGQMGNLKGPDCQTCHTNALEHAKAGGGKGVGGILGFNNKAIPADKKAAVCMSCHENNRHLGFWSSGRHAQNGVSCNNCHQMHGVPGAGANIALKKSEPSTGPYQTTQRQLQYETCSSCHKQIRTQIQKNSHHPIIEGKINCTDCHNPHGALSPAMINSESVTQLCIGCHTEKRGPFLYSHPPVEQNCLTCHNSHGSNHNRLLAEQAPNLCQDCHDAAQHPGTVYSGDKGWVPIPPSATNTRMIARGCVNCHSQIHGSNAPAARGKFFLR